MKTNSILIAAVIASIALTNSNAATVIFDDFSTGRSIVRSGGNSQTTQSISSPFVNSRTMLGSGVEHWLGQVDITSTTLEYTLSIPGGILGSDQRLELKYLNSVGNFNLLGYDAFVIHVAALSGAGQIMAYFGDSGHQLGAVPVNLTATGDLYIPLTNANSQDLGSIESVHFRILPQNANFSVTLSGISAIPEPSALLLSAFGACLLLIRRRPE